MSFKKYFRLTKASKDPKDKKGAPPVANGKKPQGINSKDAKNDEEPEKDLSPFIENTKFELKTGMNTLPGIPEFYPDVFFLSGQYSVEHDVFIDLEKHAQHQINQDDMALANNTKAEVSSKFLRKPYSYSLTNGMLIIWRGTSKMEELLFNSRHANLPKLAYNKEHLHFSRRIEEFAPIEYSNFP